MNEMEKKTMSKISPEKNDPKEAALKKFMAKRGGYTEDDMKSVTVDRYFCSRCSEYRYEACGEEFFVLEDERAYALAFQLIEDELWAFPPDFIVAHLKYDIVYCDHPVNLDDLRLAIRAAQERLCEGANAIIYALIDDLEEFVDDAIAACGRGHFISSYDGVEHEVTVDGETYYIYRLS